MRNKVLLTAVLVALAATPSVANFGKQLNESKDRAAMLIWYGLIAFLIAVLYISLSKP